MKESSGAGLPGGAEVTGLEKSRWFGKPASSYVEGLTDEEPAETTDPLRSAQILLSLNDSGGNSPEDFAEAAHLVSGNPFARRALYISTSSAEGRSEIAASFWRYESRIHAMRASVRTGVVPDPRLLLLVARRCESDGAGIVALAEAMRLGLIRPEGTSNATYFRLLHHARALGEPSASFQLAIRQPLESDPRQRSENAIALLWEAAEGGLISAELELLIEASGSVSSFGSYSGKVINIASDYRALGFSDASYLLGFMYFFGLDVEKDRDKALQFLGEATLLGSKRGERFLRDLIEDELTEPGRNQSGT